MSAEESEILGCFLAAGWKKSEICAPEWDLADFFDIVYAAALQTLRKAATAIVDLCTLKVDSNASESIDFIA